MIVPLILALRYWENTFPTGILNVPTPPKKSQVRERKDLHTGFTQRRGNLFSTNELYSMASYQNTLQERSVPSPWQVYYTWSLGASLYIPLVLYLNINVRAVKIDLSCVSLHLFPPLLPLPNVWPSHWLYVHVYYLLVYLANCGWTDETHFTQGLHGPVWTREVMPVTVTIFFNIKI